MSRAPWTPAEVEILRAHYATTRMEDLLPMLPGRTVAKIWQKAAGLGLKKSRALIATMAREAMAKPDHPARLSRFVKGHPTWNAGTHFTAGGRSAETRFKPGNRSGLAVELHKPIGTERINRDGYLERKISDDPQFGRRWRAVHILLWEAKNGPLPKGHAIVFKDGDKTHIEDDNLELISRADLMRRNTVHNRGPEIAAIYQLKGAITRQINKRNGATS